MKRKLCRQCSAYLPVIKRLRERGNAAYTTLKMLAGELEFANAQVRGWRTEYENLREERDSLLATQVTGKEGQ